MKNRSWFFRNFGFLVSRDEWVRSQAAYKTDIEIARRAREREYDSLRDGILEAKKELGRAEGTLERERADWQDSERGFTDELGIRRKVFHEWKMCTFFVDTHGIIRDVEPKNPPLVTDYFGADVEDIIGRKPSQIIPGERFFNLYTGLVEESSGDMARQGMSFESNTIHIGDEAFDIMAYPRYSGGEMKTLQGSIITIVPLRQKGWLDKLRERQRVTIEVEEEVTQEKALDYCLTMMRNGSRPVYFNFGNNRSISHGALESIAKFYRIYQNQEAICTFSGVPEEVAEILTSLEVDPRHVKGVRKAPGFAVAREGA